jgi:hypothetical protein
VSVLQGSRYSAHLRLDLGVMRFYGNYDASFRIMGRVRKTLS